MTKTQTLKIEVIIKIKETEKTFSIYEQAKHIQVFLQEDIKGYSSLIAGKEKKAHNVKLKRMSLRFIDKEKTKC